MPIFARNKPKTMTKTALRACLKAMLLAAALLTACDDTPRKPEGKDSKENKEKTTFMQQGGNPSAALTEIPRTRPGTREQILRRRGYAASYNPDWLIANWVAYEITADEASARGERGSGFEADPDIKGHKAYPRDYVRSGYDRGHLAPAGDMKWSYRAMQETFYLSNICPQNHELNNGVWNDLEQAVRRWARREGPLWVCAGPVVRKNPRRVGKAGVAVPDKFFKAICRRRNGHYQGIAYIFDNRPLQGTYRDYAISIDSLEALTGHDFFPALPDEEENRMERRTQSF